MILIAYRRMYFILGLLVLLMVAGVVHAQVDADNWCYDGEPWGDGRCNSQPTQADNDNYWECGFWAAKFDAGEIDIFEIKEIDESCFGNIVTVRFPSWLDTSIDPVCYVGKGSYNAFSFLLEGNTIAVYGGGSCGQVTGTILRGETVVYADNATEALTYCQNRDALFTVAVAVSYPTEPQFPSDLYRCER